MNALAEDPAPPPGPNVEIRSRPPSPKRLSRNVLLAGSVVVAGIIAMSLMTGLSDGPSRQAERTQTAQPAQGGPPDSIRSAATHYGAEDLPNRGATFDLDSDAGGAGADLQPPDDPAWLAQDASPPAPETRASGAGAPPPDPQAQARASAILFARGDAQNAVRTARDTDRLDTRLTPPRSRYELLAGAVIPAALITGLNSDRPGRVIAQVTAPVYDSVTGAHLLIPQGARLIGAYDNGVGYGDRRLVLVWNRLILPNGWSINLQNMDGADPTGAAGVEDRTDNHLGRLASAIGLSAIISVIANESEDNAPGTFGESVGDAAAQQAAQTGSRIVDRELTVRPTLRVRPGAPVRLLVTRDVRLRPYQEDQRVAGR